LEEDIMKGIGLIRPFLTRSDKIKRFENEIELIGLTELSGNIFLVGLDWFLLNVLTYLQNIDSRLYASYFNNIIGDASSLLKSQQFRLLAPVLRSFYAKVCCYFAFVALLIFRTSIELLLTIISAFAYISVEITLKLSCGPN
jgi:hypothetical protein